MGGPFKARVLDLSSSRLTTSFKTFCLSSLVPVPTWNQTPNGITVPKSDDSKTNGCCLKERDAQIRLPRQPPFAPDVDHALCVLRALLRLPSGARPHQARGPFMLRCVLRHESCLRLFSRTLIPCAKVGAVATGRQAEFLAITPHKQRSTALRGTPSELPRRKAFHVKRRFLRQEAGLW